MFTKKFFNIHIDHLWNTVINKVEYIWNLLDFHVFLSLAILFSFISQKTVVSLP